MIVITTIAQLFALTVLVCTVIRGLSRFCGEA